MIKILKSITIIIHTLILVLGGISLKCIIKYRFVLYNRKKQIFIMKIKCL